MDVKAFTLKSEGTLRQLITECGVSEAFDLSNASSPPKLNHYKAIWDTGATGTVITEKVALDLGLVSTGFTNVGHVKGVSVAKTYLINVYLPNKICVIGVIVTEGILGGDVEMLIGMDIISQGDFSVTNVEGKSCFSFRIPSIKSIDYCIAPSSGGTNKIPAKKKRKK